MRGFRDNYLDFLGARVARLYPLHILILLLFLATALSARSAAYLATGEFHSIPWQGPRSIEALIANLFMLQGLKAGDLSWNYPAWSISIEFIAYLIFPLVLSSIWPSSKATKIALGGILIGVLAYLAWSTGDDFNQWDGPNTLLRCLPEFMLGTLLYNLFCTGEPWRIFKSDAAAIGVLMVAIALLQVDVSDFAVVVSFAVLLPLLVVNDGMVTKILNIKPLLWLGEISYSLYLVHGFVQFASSRLLASNGITDRDDLSSTASWLLVGGMLALSFGLAAITYPTIEQIGRRQIRRFLGLGKPAAKAPIGAHRSAQLVPVVERSRIRAERNRNAAES
jgi:peptidoglycan/LPS O-acetylase OafA/YrhL